jgi:hypothetical protein
MPKDGAKPGDAKPKRKKAEDNAAASPQAPSGPTVDDNEPLPLVPEFR